MPVARLGTHTAGGRLWAVWHSTRDTVGTVSLRLSWIPYSILLRGIARTESGWLRRRLTARCRVTEEILGRDLIALRPALVRVRSASRSPVSSRACSRCGLSLCGPMDVSRLECTNALNTIRRLPSTLLRSSIHRASRDVDQPGLEITGWQKYIRLFRFGISACIRLDVSDV